jgi:hypothetical protein
MNMTYFVFIVTSRDKPEYAIFDSIRREQMKAFGIQYKFLLNGELPEGYILKDDEELFSDASFTPGMFMKFFNALNNFKEPLPDYILRLNSSTFVDFKKFEELLSSGMIPLQKCFAGFTHEFDCAEVTSKVYILAGTAMLFSRDVCETLRSIPLQNDIVQYCINETPDDYAISMILQQVGKYRLFDLGVFFCMCEDGLEMDAIDRNELSIFYRIKNKDRMEKDVSIWKDLIHLTLSSAQQGLLYDAHHDCL